MNKICIILALYYVVDVKNYEVFVFQERRISSTRENFELFQFQLYNWRLYLQVFVMSKQMLF